MWFAEQQTVGLENQGESLDLQSLPELNSLTVSAVYHGLRNYQTCTWGDTYETHFVLPDTSRASVILIMIANRTSSCYLEAAFEISAIKGTEVII